MSPEHTEADDHADTGDVEKNLPKQRSHEMVKYYIDRLLHHILNLPSLSMRVLEKTVAIMLTTPRMIVER